MTIDIVHDKIKLINGNDSIETLKRLFYNIKKTEMIPLKTTPNNILSIGEEIMNEKCINIDNDRIVINELWQAPIINDQNSIAKGDMPGDKIEIGDSHMEKAQVIFPQLLKKTVDILNNSLNQKAVISVHGGSGVGKSEIGALLAYYFREIGLDSYVLSGDNYPKRIPFYNDAERLREFRSEAIKGLVNQYIYDSEKKVILDELIGTDKDSDPSVVSKFPFMEIYQKAGRDSLSSYLGSEKEIDFQQINDILAKFKNGESNILLKRMGREINELWYEAVDFSTTNILIIEWTHGNNKNLLGVDFPILLNSTPEETLAHRRLRNRDGALDSPFTTMVLELEQELLHEQAKYAQMIISKSGEIISYDVYEERMNKK